VPPERQHRQQRLQHRQRRLLLFTKPARQGRVKTRLIGDLTAAQAAELHAAFLADLLARLAGGRFELDVLWAVEPGERVPEPVRPGVGSLRQEGAGLGERLHGALAAAARRSRVVAALGSDHPTVEVELVERAFAAIENGADVALGPAEDGGYYLIALAAGAVRRRLFEDVPWSTSGVLAATLERCAQLGLAVELLPAAADVDTPADLARLAVRLAPPGAAADGCPRTRALLARWRRLPGSAAPAAAREAADLREPIVAAEPSAFLEPAEPAEPAGLAGPAGPAGPVAPAARARRGGGR
jgi:uncharacterized protein